MHEWKIEPVEEMLTEGEFTDRVEILQELEDWYKKIKNRISGSQALIAPRRMGKTALLDRLVNIVFFKDYQVAPFYFKMKREETTLHKFLLEYFTTFCRQYIAYLLKDPEMYGSKDLSLRDLATLPSQNERVQYMQSKYIHPFLERYERYGWEDARNHWDAMITIPESIGARTGVHTAVIIDEFQDMKFYIYDTDENTLESIKQRNRGKPGYGGVDLTATYDRQSQSRKAPMLVSGSAVTLIFRTVMGGPLGGRFDFTYLKPLAIDDGASLITKLVGIYGNDDVISPENAIYASTQVGGHPYYLYCLATSKCEGKSFDSPTTIDRVITYEIEKGKIYGFWQTHFENNKEYINNDNDREIGKKIIYYFTKYSDKAVEEAEIARAIGISREEVEKKLEKLYQADLVYRTEARYYGFNDICLMRYIQFVYGRELTDVEAIDLSEEGKYNLLKGLFLEMVVQHTMRKFDGELLDGAFFGKAGTVTVPRFEMIDARYVKGEKTGLCQIDVYGRETGGARVWVCECKYRKTRMGMDAVEKVEKAAVALKQQALSDGRKVPEVRIWLVSTGGFTGQVLEYVRERDDIFISDHAGINRIFRQYGGEFDIPIFEE